MMASLNQLGSSASVTAVTVVWTAVSGNWTSVQESRRMDQAA